MVYSPDVTSNSAGLDHGGDLDRAITRFGGSASQWIDLSTGINRVPYPVSGDDISGEAWTALPTASRQAELIKAARDCYSVGAPLAALSGAQAAIQLLPQISSAADIRILAPTYNEYQAVFARQGQPLQAVAEPEELAGAETAILVNPNNPTGRLLPPDAIKSLSGKVGRLIVDESFMDITEEMSCAPNLTGGETLLLLRSFGKFYGLAGLRLGFVMGEAELVARLAAAAGPWPVSGIACELGSRGLQDRVWKEQSQQRLKADASRLDSLALAAGWRLVGGTGLFRLYDTPDAKACQDALGATHIWSRIFPWSPTWLRLGLPGGEAEWQRVERVFQTSLPRIADTSR